MYVEKDILNQVSEGDELAFAELYALYTPRLEAYIFKFTQSVLSLYRLKSLIRLIIFRWI